LYKIQYIYPKYSKRMWFYTTKY